LAISASSSSALLEASTVRSDTRARSCKGRGGEGVRRGRGGERWVRGGGSEG
jgi:hypothetical protein